MPWRLILFILLFVVLLLFIALNLTHSCDINLFFKIIPDVPVYLTALFAFALGILCAIPIAIKISMKRKTRYGSDEKNKKAANKISDDSAYSPGGPYGVN